jgi:hypothetical protein
MNVTTHDVALESLDALMDVDAICLFVAEDERPLKGVSGFVDWRLCGALSRVLQGGFFAGAPNDWLLLPSKGRLPAPRIFVGGMGSSKRLTAASLCGVLEAAAKTLGKARSTGVALELPGAGVLDDAARAGALSTAFLPGFKGHLALLSDKVLARLLPAR